MNIQKLGRLAAFGTVLLGGCSVVYPVQYAPHTPLTFNYQDDQYTFKIVDLTPAAAAEANEVWAYRPKPIPAEFSRSDAQTGYRATSLGDDPLDDCVGDDCYLIAQVARSVEGEGDTGNFEFRTPPRSEAQPYQIGVGDVITVTIESVATGTGTLTALQRDAIVDYEGNVYLTDVGEVNVLGLTVAEARQVIADRYRDSRLSATGSGTVTGFNSQKVVVSSPGKTTSFLPITTTPITLREAYLRFSSGIDEDARRQVVVLRRDGESYPIRGRDVLRQSYGYDVNLRDEDEIQIFDTYLSDVPAAAIAPDVLALNESRREQARLAREEARAERAEQRAAEAAARERAAAQRAREQLELARIDSSRKGRAEDRADAAESRALREEARRDAAETRALREEARRDAAEARALRDEARADAAEARAEREEAREARELELAETRDSRDATTLELSRERDARDRARARFDLGLERKDRFFVAGEVGQQQALDLPYGRQYTLAEAIYDSKGIQPITGDPTKVYVVRAKSTVGNSVESFIFRFDGSNLANTAAMTTLEIRPNDYVVVLPRAITNFSRFVSQILPSFSGAISAASVATN